MKKMLLLIPALACLFLVALPAEEAEAYWGYRQYEHARTTFRPRFAVSLSGGIHFVDFFQDGSYGFTYGIVQLGGHLWIHPNISIDLGVAGHLTASNWSGAGWGYIGIKPGVRFRLGLFYLRTALDFGFGDPQQTPRRAAEPSNPFLMGILLGAGIRLPVTRNFRAFGELTYQFNFTPEPLYMPFYGQVGVEVVF